MDAVIEDEESRDEPETPPCVLAPSTGLASAYASSIAKNWAQGIAQAMPAIDMAKIAPKIDTSILAAAVDTSWLSAEYAASVRAVTSMISAADLIPKADFSHLWVDVDATSALQLMDTAEVFKGYGLAESFAKDLKGIDLFTAGIAAQMKDLSQVFEPFLEQFRGIDWDDVLRRQSVPDNWSRDAEGRLETLVEMVSGEGIPAAWVPRAEILEALLDASPGDERSELLIARREDILEDCAKRIDDLEDDFLAPVLPVARQVLDVCRTGHWQVSAIAAVTVVHNVVEALHWVSDRQRVAKHHRLTMETPLSMLLEQATRAPLVLFYDDWHPQSGQPRPAHLTRHVVSHRLDADQVTERNCIVAVMLMSSLLVTVYQLELGSSERAA